MFGRRNFVKPSPKKDAFEVFRKEGLINSTEHSRKDIGNSCKFGNKPRPKYR